MGLHGFTRRKRGNWSTNIFLFSLLEMRVDSEKRSPEKFCYSAGMRLVDRIWENRRSGEDMQAAHLLP